MGGHDLGHAGGTAGLAGSADALRTAAPAVLDDPEKSGPGAPPWDRFVHWRQSDARYALITLLFVVFVSAFVPVHAGKSTIETQSFSDNIAKEGVDRPRDDDLALYDRAVERIRDGEHYYDFIVTEQRAAQYPIRPGIAVRLPTLAYLNAWAGDAGQMLAAILLLLAVLVVWWRRLGEEPGGRRHRVLAFALLFVGASLGVNKHFFALHELWAGMLLALAFGLHRVNGPNGSKWGASLAVAALAVAIREHALPFILLMGAMAFWRRDWKEGSAWSVLAIAFLVALAIHLQIISEQVLPSDQTGQGWMQLRGMSGWISNVVLSSNLRFLPDWLAGPAIMLMIFGWAAWRSPAGIFGLLLFLGYGLAFMIAGRPDNFYWGAVIAPAMFIGLAFVPMGLKSLIGATSAKHLRASHG